LSACSIAAGPPGMGCLVDVAAVAAVLGVQAIVAGVSGVAGVSRVRGQIGARGRGIGGVLRHRVALVAGGDDRGGVAAAARVISGSARVRRIGGVSGGVATGITSAQGWQIAARQVRHISGTEGQ